MCKCCVFVSVMFLGSAGELNFATLSIAQVVVPIGYIEKFGVLSL